MAQVFSIASGKGGVGKTLVTAALGTALAIDGRKVLLIDGDMGLRNMDLVLGLENECFYNICDLAEGRCFLEDAVLSVADNLDFLPASQTDSWETVFPAAMDMVLEDIHWLYDFILIDCPAGMGKGIETAFHISNKILLVVAPSWASRRNADRLLPLIPQGRDYRYILNQFSEMDDTSLSFDEIMETVDAELFGGVIPYSRRADRLGHNGHIYDMDRESAFVGALEQVLLSVVEGKEFSENRWKSFIRLSDKENGKDILRNNDEKNKRSGLSWHSGSPAYKWHRRR